MNKIGALTLPQHAEIHGTGLASWKNPGNGFYVLAIHYTSDEDKRGTEWKKEASQPYSVGDWRQEYEMDFSTFAGRPIYQSFNGNYHIAPERLPYTRRRKMLRGWDVGIHACVWAQKCNNVMSVYTARIVSGAFIKEDNPAKYKPWEVPVSGLRVFIEHCLQISDELFPDVEWVDYIDRAAFYNTARHGEKPIEDFHALGLQPIEGTTQDLTLRVSAVEDWMNVMVNGQPGFQISPGELLLVDAFTGGYKYDKDGLSAKALKNGFSHPMDAFQYMCLHVQSPRRGLWAPQEEVVVTGMDPARHDLGPGSASILVPDSVDSEDEWWGITD